MSLDLDAIRTREAAATAGPWAAGGPYVHPWEVVISTRLPFVELTDTPQGRADAEFIAHAREDVAVLLNAVAALQEAVAQIEQLRSDAGWAFLAGAKPAIGFDALDEVLAVVGPWTRPKETPDDE